MVKKSSVLIPPNGIIQINTFTINTGTKLFRIHPSCYAGNQFNPSSNGDARFSPIKKLGTNQIIPTMYAGFNTNIALSETIFRDLDITQKNIKVYIEDFNESCHTELETTKDLNLAMLDLTSLVKMRVSKDLIHCSPEFYVITRIWAEHIHSQHSNIVGLIWPSRQHTGEAIILFGDRINMKDLKLKNTISVMDTNIKKEIIQLAERLGVAIDSRDNPISN